MEKILKITSLVLLGVLISASAVLAEPRYSADFSRLEDPCSKTITMCIMHSTNKRSLCMHQAINQELCNSGALYDLIVKRVELEKAALDEYDSQLSSGNIGTVDLLSCLKNWDMLLASVLLEESTLAQMSETLDASLESCRVSPRLSN